MSGRVVAVCLGSGGIPKHPVDVAHVTELGLEGDGHRYRLHGGANRAVCILSVEEVRSLEADGVEVAGPGTFGENVLYEGLEGDPLRPGDRLKIGDSLVIELHDVREPCRVLKSVDSRFPNLMLGRSGFVARVTREGDVRPGDAVART